MSLLAPWALVGLAALPVLWWIHRRMQRPLDVILPSLMFLQDEAEESKLRTRRRVDWMLLLTLATAAAMVLAAAGPNVVRGEAIRRIRVVVATGHTDAADPLGVVETIRRASGGDEVDVVVERRRVDALLAAARAGHASVRYVITDQVPPGPTPDVHWIGIGDPGASNAAVLSATLREQDGAWRLLVVVFNDGLRPVDAQIGVRLGRGSEESLVVERVKLPATGALSRELALPAAAPGAEVLDAWVNVEGDARNVDDVLTLSREVVPVAIDPRLDARLRDALEAARAAIPGRTRVAEALGEGDQPPGGLNFTAPGAGRGRGYAVSFEDGPEEPVPPDAVEMRRDAPFTKDLSTRGVTWHAARRTLPPEARVYLGLRRGEDIWPLLWEEDPLELTLYVAAPATDEMLRSSFLPLLVENLVDWQVGGEEAGLGYRTSPRAVDDVRVGRDVKPFDPETLRRAPKDHGMPPVNLRPLLIGLALALLAALTVVGFGVQVRRGGGRERR